MVSQLIIKTGFTEKTYAKAMAMSAVFFVFIGSVSIIQLTLMKKREVGIDG
jgi:ABC-type sugar transport system permease subunit